ncbi:MAG: hypothetical protein NVS3B20_02390 [Polyangiales bacterium]
MRRTESGRARWWSVNVPALMVSVSSLTFLPPGEAIAGSDHVCARDEGQGGCPAGRVRMCSKDGAKDSCACPPGAKLAAGNSGRCELDLKAPVDKPCVSIALGIDRVLAADLAFGNLRVPSLPTLTPHWATEVVSDLDTKRSTLGVTDLAKLANAHERIEGGASYEASLATLGKAKALEDRRNDSLDQAIAVRQIIVGKFPSDPAIDEQRVLLARSLLRRVAYRRAPFPNDRPLAIATLEKVSAASAVSTSALRDASFILAEEAVDERAWNTVIERENALIKCIFGKLQVDDAAYRAAAHARLAEARLALADFAGAKSALIDAVDAGSICAPRAECVAAASGARNVLAAVWAATGSPPRTMAKILQRGAMPTVQRVRPLVQLAEALGKAAGASCVAQAEEARAWSRAIR